MPFALGILTQAYFGRHLVGVNPSTLGIKKKELAKTIFICDSNITIPLLAEGSVGHEYALALFRKMFESGSPVITSDWLLEECAEHARWAWDILKSYGPTSHEVIDAARGAQGYKNNAFLSGYLNHPKFGPDIFFKQYFAYVFNDDGERPNVKSVSTALVKRGILLQQLDQWVGFSDQLYGDRDVVQTEIERRRRNNGTYKRERQVKAEAEVAISITGVRRNKLKLADRDIEDGYFLSHSRVVDNIQGQARRITIHPESLLEWILSIGEISDVDADALYDQMLWDLSKDGIELVSHQQLLRMFSNTIDVSRLRLDEIVSEHRDIIRDRYATDPETAFSDVDPLAL